MPVFSHMLVALDGSRLAEAVLPPALGLAAGVGAKVTLLHVLEHHPPQTVHGEPHLADVAAAKHYLDDVVRRYAHGLPDLKIECHVHENAEDDVPASIVAHAEELQADLVALTPHGKGDLRRWLMGSKPQLVLQKGTTPVLFVPSASPAPGENDEERAPYQLRRLLVPLDQHEAETVLQTAQSLQEVFGASVELLHVVPTLGTMRGDQAATATFTPVSTAATLEIEEQQDRDYFEALAANWPGGEKPSVSVLRGDPATVILEVIQQREPDLVLMSTHGHSGLAGLVSASVAARVIAHSTRPLLLMRVTQ